MTTIAIANQKGGVGKTTIAFNIASIFSKSRSTNILAIDNDPLSRIRDNGSYPESFVIPKNS